MRGDEPERSIPGRRVVAYGQAQAEPEATGLLNGRELFHTDYLGQGLNELELTDVLDLHVIELYRWRRHKLNPSHRINRLATDCVIQLAWSRG